MRGQVSAPCQQMIEDNNANVMNAIVVAYSARVRPRRAMDRGDEIIAQIERRTLTADDPHVHASRGLLSVRTVGQRGPAGLA